MATLLECVRQVVFIATPHTGSRHATWIDRLRFLAWPSSAATSLVANDPGLRSLNVSYRDFADDQRQQIKHRIFYEMRKTPAGMIVDGGSGDAGLPDCRPVPIDADHISICKPAKNNALLYARIRDFISELGPKPAQAGTLKTHQLPPISTERSLNLVPIAVRIAALLFIGAIAVIGLDAMRRSTHSAASHMPAIPGSISPPPVGQVPVSQPSVSQTIRIEGNQNNPVQTIVVPAPAPSDAPHQKGQKIEGQGNQVIQERIR